MSWTLHTSGGAIATAGANTNTDVNTSGSILAKWSNEAESFVCNTARVDFINDYGNLKDAGKYILASICDAYVAQKIINYEPAAIGTTEATLRLNFLQTQIAQGLNQIEGDKVKTYLGAT